MLFYFVTHTLLGMVAGAAAHSYTNSRQNVGAYPLWIQNEWAYLWVSVPSIGSVLAIITTLFQWGLLYTLFTIAELVLGAILVGFVSREVRVFLALVGPFVTILFLGAYWGFWYI